MPDQTQTTKATGDAASKIRQPRQKRSIEKKNKIIKAGLELICEKGYQSTTTADIAKRAGVSTGIVYNYFKDKKDILLSGLSDYIVIMQSPALDFLRNYHAPEDWDVLLNQMIDKFVESHKLFANPHQELTALAALDPDINAFFEHFEKATVSECVALFSEYITPIPHLYEKFHIVYHLVEDFCHEVVLKPSPEFDYDALRQEVISSIRHLLEI